MSKKFHAALGYPAFNHSVRKIEAWLNSRSISILGYGPTIVASRLAQRVVELGLIPYIKCYAESYAIGAEKEFESGRCSFGDLVSNSVSGYTRPSIGLFIKSLIEFHAHWIHALCTVIFSFLKSRKPAISATLVFGVGLESLFAEGNDRRFINYCRIGPIEPLNSSSRLVIQALTKNQSTEPNYATYCRFPLFGLLASNSLGFFSFIRFLQLHILVALTYWFAIARVPLISLIGRDFAYHAVAKLLNDHALIEAVVLTNSNYSAQPIWMIDLPNKRYETHMVWYAQNTVPIVYKGNPVLTNTPNYLHLKVDVSWVWTDGYADYLKSLQIPGEIKVVGPIVWHLPSESTTGERKSNELVLTVFDVTPVNNEFAETIGLFGNYYSPENMIAFINQIKGMKVALEKSLCRRIRVVLKHKRSYNPAHDPEYLALVEEAIVEGSIELAPFDTNIYSLISGSDLVIVIPYSSPAYVADALGVPSVFFDPTCEILPIYEAAENIQFAAGQKELFSAIYEQLSFKKSVIK